MPNPHHPDATRGGSPGRCPASTRNRRGRGFTLIELLVAITVMSVMALMSWRGLDGMLRAHAQTQARNEQISVLQTTLGQWSTDLDQIATIPNTVPINWDGLVLRLTRLSPDRPDTGARVVAWTRRDAEGTPQWLRWQSPPVRTLAEWEQAWNQAAQWSRNPGAEERRREVALVGLLDWQVFYHRGGAWTNPQSSPTNTAGDNDSTIPEAVRIELTLPPGPGISGRITRDWLNPTPAAGAAP